MKLGFSFSGFGETVRTVYNRIYDEESKEIFTNRLMYSLTNDYGYIRKIVRGTELSKTILGELLSYQAKGYDMVLDGAGEYGWYIFNDYPEIKWRAISDKSICPQYSFPEVTVLERRMVVEKFPMACYCISSINYFDEIENELLDLGISEDQIVNIGRKARLIENEMYFDVPEIRPHKNNCLIDCGAFHGESSESFIRWCGNKQYEVLAVEPDYENYVVCNSNLMANNNVKVLNAAVYSESTHLRFNSSGTRAASITPDGGVEIDSVSVDDIAKNKHITFIKWDVEGTEREAIIGATETIKREMPVLAISVYHKMEDIVDLLKLCLEIVPNYKFILRHYTLGSIDTVAFAVNLTNI